LTRPVLLGAIWSLFLLASCLNLRYLLRKYPTPPKYAWLWITLIALFARLIPNVILPMGAEYDIESFRIAGSLILQGKDVYASPLAIDRHPYLPLQMYWMATAVWIADNLNLSFVAIFRLLPIFADLGVALLLFQILRVKDQPAAFHGALWYALSPIPVFISAYHGQFDALPIFLIILALYYLGRSSWLSGTWMGLAILAKSWPVLALPSLIQGVRKFVNVRDLDIDLIDRINPFDAAYSILGKTMDEKTLRQVQASIAAKKLNISYDEARDLAQRALQFKKERGRLPDINAQDPWEKRMAEGIAALARHRAQQKAAEQRGATDV